MAQSSSAFLAAGFACTQYACDLERRLVDVPDGWPARGGQHVRLYYMYSCMFLVVLMYIGRWRCNACLLFEFKMFFMDFIKT